MLKKYLEAHEKFKVQVLWGKKQYKNKIAYTIDPKHVII